MNRYRRILENILAQVDERLRVMPANDDSMARRFRRNDLLIVDPWDWPVESGVALLDLGDGPTPVEVKRMRDGRLRFTKHDMLWRPIELTDNEARARMVGRVVGAVVRFKARC